MAEILRCFSMGQEKENRMNYIVFDLEWNQAAEGKIKENKDIPFEIIEIGAVRLDQDKNETGEFNQLVKPAVYQNMHHITKNLIHLKMEELKQGKSFKEVIKDFLEWCGEDYIFCTWGPLDLIELQRNMKYYGIEPLATEPIRYLDIQKLFSRQFEDKKSRRTLEYAIDYLKIEKDIPFHRAFSDAYYTGKVLAKLGPDAEAHFSIDVYKLPGNRKEEVHVSFGDYAKYISREFKDKTTAMLDREVTSTKCYICNKALRKKVKWFTPNGKHYFSISVCPIHGYMKGKIRIRKTENEAVYVVKTLRFIEQNEIDEIMCRQEKTRENRQQKRKGRTVKKTKKTS